MIQLSAPYSAPQFSVEIRNPELGDNLSLDTRVTWKHAADGTVYGYKKTPALKKHTLVFKELTRRKGLEILQFLKDIGSYDIRYTDVVGNVWQGIISNNPSELITVGVGVGPDTDRKESNQITLQFIGVSRLIGVFWEDFTPMYNETFQLARQEV